LDLEKLQKEIIDPLDAVMGAIGGGVGLVSLDRHIVHYGRTFTEWFGPVEQNKGASCFRVFRNREERCPFCPLRSFMANPDEPVAPIETEIFTTSGASRPVRFIYMPIRDPNGELRYVAKVVQDITEKRTSEWELSERNRMLAMLNRIAGVLLASPSLEEVSGIMDELELKAACLYILDEVTGAYNLAADKGVPPEVRQGLETVNSDDALARIAEGQRECRMMSEKDFRNKRSVMRPWPLADTKVAMLMPLRSIERSVGFALFLGDETRECVEEFSLTVRSYLTSAVEKRLLFRKLHELENRYRHIFEASPDELFVVDADLTILDANSACRRSGYAPEELIGRSALEFLPPEYHSMASGLVERILSGERVIVEVESILKDGSRRPEEFSISKCQFAGKDAAIVVSRDITDRKKADREARRLAKLTQTATDAIILVGTDLKITVWNPGAERIFGHSAEEALGNLINLIHTSAQDVEDIQKALMEKGEFIGEKICRKKNGEPISVVISVSCVQDDSGNIEGYLGFLKDVTEAKQTQQQLFQSQKMQSIGTLAGGIAHDFNNILSGVLGHASLLKELVPPESTFYKNIHEIESSAQRAATLTKQLLSFAKGGKYQPRLTNINNILSEALELISRTMGASIVVDSDLQPDAWTVEVDRTQMQQVLMNLCINSREAMPDGGTLTIETRNVEVTEEEIKPVYIPMTPGKYVRMSVADTGAGMDEETKRRAFEPFFSNKKEGTGLGLAMVYGIISNHKGFITLYSEPGKGTTIRAYLPAVEKAAEERPAEPVREVHPGEGTILIIDDEPVVRNVLARMLERMGYNVIAAGTGRDGVAIYSDKKDEIDLVLLDMIIPDMPGGQIFSRLQEIDPDVQILLSSGFTETEVAIEAQRRGALGFLEKPYTMGDLSDAVRRALNKEKRATNAR